jgi:MFS family permease
VQFLALLRQNPNYRSLWVGQLVSETGYHFNSIAALSLSLHLTGSGSTVGAVMIARTLPAILVAPMAGVYLDRLDRRHVMIASELFRAAIALAFLLVLEFPRTVLLYGLSALLMVATPFFTAGRSSILPDLAEGEQLHAANAMTQTTSWLTLSLGTMLGGAAVAAFGYRYAFLFNAASFLFSAWSISRLRGSFRSSEQGEKQEGLTEFLDGLRLLWRTPLLLAIALAGVGWASGGGAAQILFTLFGEVVFKAGPAGVGLIWGFAGVGLVLGGLVGLRAGQALSFEQYKWAIAGCFFVIGGAYMAFTQMETMAGAVVFITLSRVAMGANNVLNRSMLLHHVPDAYRGRVFATVEMLMNVSMMVSMTAAALAVDHYPIRLVGLLAGALTGLTAVLWTWANLAGKLRPLEAPE